MKTKNYLCFYLIIAYFITGCSAFRKNEIEQMDINSIEKRIGPKKVDVDTVITKLTQQISQTLYKQQKRKVAVMDFTLPIGEMTELGFYISDKFTNGLFLIQDKFEVIERKRIKSILAEMELGFTGIIDEKTAQSVGKISGADAIVIGTITDLKDEVDINVRMIGTERGNIIAVANSLLKKNQAIDSLIKNIITKPGSKHIKVRKTEPEIKPDRFENIDTNWHKYQDRKSDVWGKSEHVKKISVTSDGWRIIAPVDENKDEYEWGWELTLIIELPDESPDSGDVFLGISEIKYTLLDEDGFILISDSYNISQEGTFLEQDMVFLHKMGEEKTYRHTSEISKQKALRAKSSKFLISIK